MLPSAAGGKWESGPDVSNATTPAFPRRHPGTPRRGSGTGPRLAPATPQARSRGLWMAAIDGLYTYVLQPEPSGMAVRNQNVEAAPGSRAPKDVADYIATLSRDLSDLARRNDFVTLAYLLDMARLEAETTSRGGGREGIFRLPSEKQVDAS